MTRQLGLWAIVFLVVLRLAIGWQFFTEGAQKVRSNYVLGPSEMSKPFSSEGYFRNSSGPFSALMRTQIVDPDEQLVAFTKLEDVPADVQPSTHPPAERMPVELAKAWQKYLDQVHAFYALDGTQVERAKAALRQAQANYVAWLLTGEKELTRKLSGNDVKMKLSTAERVKEYLAALTALREYDSKRWLFFREVDKDKHALARARVIELRTDLAKDVDEQTSKMAQALADIVRAKIDDALVLPGEPQELQAELVELLTLATTPAQTTGAYPLAGYLSPALGERWTEYLDALTTQLKVTPPQREIGKRLLDKARHDTVRWLLDEQVQGPRAGSLAGVALSPVPFTPLAVVPSALAQNANVGPLERLAAFRTEKKRVEDLRKLEQAAVDSRPFTPSENLVAAEKNLAALTKSLKADLDARTKLMKDSLEEMLDESQKKVAPPPPPRKWTVISTLDLVTICVITGAGLLLLLGLFTRTACVLAAGFLLLTFLSAPPLPWLPLPPGTEGNPIYVNKNLIEFFALLALAGTASGKWFGIDALLARLFGKPEDEPAGETPAV